MKNTQRRVTSAFAKGAILTYVLNAELLSFLKRKVLSLVVFVSETEEKHQNT